jgi:glycosyltransferase involved in cell wall biosynthesis
MESGVMRIGILAPPWAPVPPPLYGGIEQAIDGLARGFVAAGHEVVLFTTGDSTSPVPRRWELDRAEGYRMGFTVPELRQVMAAYEAFDDVDIVHDHSVMGPVYARGLGGHTVVTTNHGPFNEELTAIYRRIAADVPIIAISHAQRRAAPELPVGGVIHHGIDASEFPVGDGRGDYCLFLGRMSPDKGAHWAAGAARKAGARLLIAGKCREPWEQSYFDEQVRPLLDDDIEYLGEVLHDDKVRLLAEARCVLFPIRWNEPFGLVMVEAMACGTPVLAFPEGAAPEVVDHGRTGFLCEDVAEMADAIAAVADLDRGDCRAATEGYFSMRRCAEEHIELFSGLLGR